MAMNQNSKAKNPMSSSRFDSVDSVKNYNFFRRGESRISNY